MYMGYLGPMLWIYDLDLFVCFIVKEQICPIMLVALLAALNLLNIYLYSFS